MKLREETLRLQQSLIKQEQTIRELELKENPISDKLKEKIVKIRTLRETMGYCFGQGIMGSLQDTIVKPLFDEEELYEYKAKLQTLIKSL